MLSTIFNYIGYTKTSLYESAFSRAEAQYKSKVSFREKYTDKSKELTIVQEKYKKKCDDYNKLNSKTDLSKVKLQNWAKKVKASKQCDCCGDIDVPLQAHHLWAKSVHKTLAYETTNGVPLCLDCHSGYHKKYPHISDCNPYTYSEFKTDENNKIRLSEVENEVKELKAQSLSKTAKTKIMNLLRKA